MLIYLFEMFFKVEQMNKRILLVILLLIVVNRYSNCQNNSKQKFDEIKNNNICNKAFDTTFIKASNIASAAYPELQDISIVFKRGEIKTIMAARPIFLAIFHKSSKREYQIILSNSKQNDCEQLFCQISMSALIGILGHEYAHLLTYNDKSSIQLVFYAVNYLFNKKKIERETDLIAIKKGFGKNLLEYNLYVTNCNFVSKKYLKNRENNYLSINEIREKINR
jgi:hypothetical protein